MSQTPFPSISIIDDGFGGAADALVPKTAGGNGVSPEPGSNHSHMVIIGSGPAGLTAAIYAARANLEPIVIGGYAPGGQLMITSDVENYPGFPDGIQGPELMDLFREQAERFGSRIVDVDLERGRLLGPALPACGPAGQEYTADSVDRRHRRQRLAGPRQRDAAARPRRVSACATCDGFFFRGKKVAVVGGGDTALEEATFLTRFATEVVLLHRRDQFRGSKIMQERAAGQPQDQRPLEQGSRRRARRRGGRRPPPARHRRPATRATRRRTACSWPSATSPTRTSSATGSRSTTRATWSSPTRPTPKIDGVFIAGDVHDHRYRQAVTAAADGCKAAIDAERWLEAEGIARPQPPPRGDDREEAPRVASGIPADRGSRGAWASCRRRRTSSSVARRGAPGREAPPRSTRAAAGSASCARSGSASARFVGVDIHAARDDPLNGSTSSTSRTCARTRMPFPRRPSTWRSPPSRSSTSPTRWRPSGSSTAGCGRAPGWWSPPSIERIRS